MIDLFKHLLPRARAWSLTESKPLRSFFEALSKVFEDVKKEIDLIYFDLDPFKTRKLKEWEREFGLADYGLTEDQRRERLDAEWKAFGGQDPAYIQRTLQAAGFDVYIHEWWEPDTNPPIPRDPFQVLWDGVSPRQIIMSSGNQNAFCGGDAAFCLSQNSPPGYPLVNKVFTAIQNPIGAGHSSMSCGEQIALCGAEVTSFRRRQYVLPVDENTKYYTLYIGGKNFPEQAIIPASRREELEDLCLKLCPTEQWIGMLITYT